MVVVAGLVAEVAVVAVVSKPPSLLVAIAVVDSSNQSTKDQLGEETLKVQKKANHLLLLSANSDPIQVANQKKHHVHYRSVQKNLVQAQNSAAEIAAHLLVEQALPTDPDLLSRHLQVATYHQHANMTVANSKFSA